MRSFLLDNNGDVVIKGSDILMVEGSELLAQKVRTVLGTNKGEWFANEDEGIDNRVILGKNHLTAQADKFIKHSGDLSEAEELKLAALLEKRLDGEL